jgi:transposase
MIIAVARKLVMIVFLMLKNNEPYRYARPELMREKFSVLKDSLQRAQSEVRFLKAKLGRQLSDAKLPRIRIPNQLPKGEQHMLEDR